ncbi:MAG: hypothetical protein RR573_03415 [Oscillospiraceae bacterium]
MDKALPPIWMIFVMPTYLPIVWLVDMLLVSAIVMLSLKAMKKEPINEYYKRCIIKVWIFTYIAQLIGAIAMSMSAVIDFLLPQGSTIKDFWFKYVTNFIAYNPLASLPAATFALIALIISGVLIYLFNYNFAFKKTELNHGARKRISLALTLFASPYIFLIPTVFLFGK